ncbi:MAG TPA: filamentous hemagglutinin N-terminal domain-containing protein [Candidatus Obscuribacterales bacterium]
MKLYINPFWIAVALTSCCLATTNSLLAQQLITPDGTLSTKVGSPDDLNFTITDGTRAGGNLFHSFTQFSVPAGGMAFFNNATDIVNIIGRVTGGTVSNIDGLIRANGTANLFLLNPNGIVFGAGARLDIGGSFLASTASAVKFADGTEFNAKEPSPLLTINVPIGLQYNGAAAGIDVQGANLLVEQGNTLALVGGQLTFNGGILEAEGGSVILGAVAGTGTVGLTQVNNGLQLSFSPEMQLANMSLTNGTLINTSGSGGGDIEIFGRQIKLIDSRVEANTLGSSSGGNLNVFASESVEITGNNAGGTFSNGLFAENAGSGASTNLMITTGNLIVEGEARISTAAFGSGSGGNLTINAADSVKLIGIDPTDSSGTLFTGLLTDAHDRGSAGNLTINTGRLIVQDGAQVTAATYGSGKGGDLSVRASQDVQLLGVTPSDLLASGLYTAVQPGATGNAGNITVDTRQLVVRDGAQIFTGTTGAGNGGNLTVNASDSIELQGTSPIYSIAGGLFSATDENSTGSAGNLTVNTGRLIIRDGALVLATTSGTGGVGALTVNATDFVQLTGAASLDFSPSGIFASVRNENNGNRAGDIKINTGQLIIQGGSQIGVNNQGQGNGGSIDIQASKLVIDNANNPNNDNPGGIKATTVSGNGGNITLEAQDLLLVRHGGAIATDATAGTGNGGNIQINTDIFTALENSDSTAKAIVGQGGNINITAQGIFLSPNSDLNASSQLGIDGQVNINTPATDPSKGLVVLPTQVVNVEGLVAQGCSAGRNIASQNPVRSRSSSFIVTGRGGLPPNPSETLISDTVLSDWGTAAVERVPQIRHNPAESRSDAARRRLRHRTTGEHRHAISNHPITRRPDTIVEAQGWMVNKNGEVFLTAQIPKATTDRPAIAPGNCPIP